MSEAHELSVRRAVSGDLDDLACLWHESALLMDGSPDVPPREALRSRIDAELRSGWDLHVALRGERLVGMLALKPGDACLDQIFVSPAEQGAGVGRELMRVAKRLMPAGFTLRVAASNERARRFYDKEGLKLRGDGFHPWTGIPVQYYGWNPGRGSDSLMSAMGRKQTSG